MRKSITSAKSSAGRRPRELRPGDLTPQTLERAALWVDGYRFVTERTDDGTFMAHSIELPAVVAMGDSPEAALHAAIEAQRLAVALMLHDRVHPPLPTGSGKRDQQVNVRMSAQERLLMDAAAKASGFSTIADYLRTAAIEFAKNAASPTLLPR
ncbi:MAG: type II toxin-antitoxin system HicB family antitoxin [Phycisphaerales bacterium]